MNIEKGKIIVVKDYEILYKIKEENQKQPYIRVYCNNSLDLLVKTIPINTIDIIADFWLIENNIGHCIVLEHIRHKHLSGILEQALREPTEREKFLYYIHGAHVLGEK